MKQAIEILKLGASKKEFPHYCQYANFMEDKIRTCNGQVFVEINNPFEIEGCINLFILEDILKNCDNPQIYQDNNSLKVEDGSFKSKLIVDSLEFPDTPDVNDIESIKLNGLYDILKEAIKFVGDKLYSYIYICNDCIIATNKSRCFFHKVELNLTTPIGVDTKIFSSLNKSSEIGVKDFNTVAVYDNGMVIFQASLLEDYPKDRVVKFINKSRSGVNKLCNVYALQTAVKKISPMLLNENSSVVELRNAGKKLQVCATSAINGVSSMSIDTEIEEEFKLHLNNKFLNNINIDYDIYINLENEDRLYLNNGISEIVLMGVRV